MRNFRTLLALTAALILPATGVWAASSKAPARPRLYSDRVVVVSRTAAGAETLSGELSSSGLKPAKSRGNARGLVLRAPKGKDPLAFAEELEKRAGVAYASPDYEVRALYTPNDPKYSSQWDLPSIGMPAAWDVTKGSGVKVAVIDTGVDLDHPDLSGNVDTTNDYDFVNGDSVADDDNGHGTHVAGTIAARTGNGTGVAGIAPAARILPLKVMDATGAGSGIDTADAIRYAADHGAEVINMSLGSDGADSYTRDAVAYALSKDVVIVAAAGNNGLSTVDYPAAYPGVVSVAASGSSKTLQSWSNYGPGLDMTAPGTSILSTYKSAGYAIMEGTSMSTPHVAGVAALIRAEHPSWNALQVQAVLKASAEDRGTTGYDTSYGYGVLRADGAVGWKPSTGGQTAAAGTGYSESFSPSGSSDWLVFNGQYGHRYRAYTASLSSSADTYLTVWSPDGSILGQNNDRASGDRSSLVDFSADGQVVLQVTDATEAGGTYQVRVDDLDLPPSAWTSPTASTTTPSYGGQVVLSAGLRDASSTPLPGAKTVEAQYSYDNVSWKDSGSTSTASTGDFSVSVHPTRAAYWRLSWIGDGQNAGSVSAPVFVKPKAYLTTPSAPATVARGAAFTSSGLLKPRHAAGSYAATMQAFRYENGKWVLRWTAWAKASNYSTYSRYSARFALTSRGKWRIRGRHAADSTNAQAFSAWRYVTVQ